MTDPDERPPSGIGVAVVTVSDTRDEASDRSGALIVERLASAGHTVHVRRIVRDEPAAIRAAVEECLGERTVTCVVTTGGTGLTHRDVTIEAVAPLVDKDIPGFGELFRWLSYEEVGAATIQSRAFGAVCRGRLLFCLPGSTGAVRLALDRILVPQLDARTRPCNFVELLPRLGPASGTPSG